MAAIHPGLNVLKTGPIDLPHTGHSMYKELSWDHHHTAAVNMGW